MNFLTLVNGLRTFVSRVDFIDIANGSFRIRLTGTATADRQVDLPNDTGTVLLDDRPVGSLNAGVSLRGYEPIVNVTTNKTLALTDAGTTQVITGSGSAIVAIPLNSSVAFPVGTRIVVVKGTTGAVAVSWGAGLTINIEGSLYTSASNASVYTSAILRKTGSDTWSLGFPVAINQFLPGTPTAGTASTGSNNNEIASTAFVQNAIASIGSIVTVASSKTLSLTDRNTVQLCTAASTVTVPLNAAVAFAIGAEILIQRNTNAAITLASSGGVSVIDEFGSAISITAVSNFTLIKKIATDTWLATNPIPNSAFLPGSPTCQTQAAGTNSIAVATTAFVQAAVANRAATLVSAQQNTAVTLTSGVYTLVPFSTEISDTSNLFASGAFTPAVTGTYRISCNLFFNVSTGAVGLYAVGVFQAGSAIGTISLNNATGVNVGQSGNASLQLASGTAYEVRAFSNGTTPTIYVGSGIQNTLTIERLL